MTHRTSPVTRTVTLTAVTAGVGTALALLGPGQATAAPDARASAPGVPTLAQARSVAPRLTTVEKGPTDELYVPDGNCRRQKPVKGSAGRLAIYDPAAGTNLTRNNPQVFSQTLRFGSRAKAKKVFRRYAKFTRNCRRVSDQISTSTITPVRLPKVGDQRTGYLITATPRTGNLPPAWGRYATVRRGKVVVVAWMVSAHDAAPRATWHRRWVTLAARAAH